MIKTILSTIAIIVGLILAINAALIWGIAHNQPELDQKADAVIVLGAAINSPSLKNRTLEGLEIYEQGKAEIMILSGGKIADPDISEAEYMEKVIKKNAAGEVNYVLEEDSHSTYESIVNAKRKLAEINPDADSIIIVSDSYHLARAVLLAKRLGFETVYWNSPSSGYYERGVLRYYYFREFAAMLNYIPKFIFGYK